MSSSSDTDTDRTIDSDELRDLASGSNDVKRKINAKKPAERTSKFHQISESDSEEEQPKKKKTAPNTQTDSKPKCRYGKDCYRKNPEHIKNFSHDDKAPAVDVQNDNLPSNATNSSARDHTEPVKEMFNNYHFHLTKVSGIPPRYNEVAFDIKDILSFTDGDLISSAQFNYMHDIPWLMQQYPQKYRTCPLLIVHGEQRDAKRSLEKTAANFSNVKFCQATLDIPFGTHHTKMMFLLYKEGFRIVIHTSNIVQGDWFQKTQGMWISPLLPKLRSGSGESPTNFKADLLEYVSSYNSAELQVWIQTIKEHDFSDVKVVLIGSVPGRHVGSRKTAFGHLKLRKVLNLHGPNQTEVKTDWPVVGQFSSIGSLGSSPDQWLTGEFLTSLSTVKGSPLLSGIPNLKLVYPTVENVRKSLEGYPAGASLPYSIKVAPKQLYLKDYLHQWKSDFLGRSEACPHIKTYLRASPSNAKMAWFLVTSANLSKAAWGALEKKGSQFMIRSYELGVLFLPKHFDEDIFLSPMSTSKNQVFPVPYDLPLERYSLIDEPWIWDIPHIQGPDRYGNKWCPPL